MATLTENKPRELSLFSGAGGGLLASQHIKGWKTVCYVEWEKYPVRVLRKRIEEGFLDDAPIWDDVRTFDGKPWRGLVDIISAGFPCQPFSNAGHMRAGDDPKNAWPSTIRIIREVRPRIVFLENVASLLAGSHGYFGTVLGQLAEAGYDAEWGVLGAVNVGAPHHRKRLWIRAVSNTASEGERRSASRMETEKSKPGNGCDYENLRKLKDTPRWWSEAGEAECGVGRMVDGMAHRMDRLRAIGNGQVPAVAAKAWELLNE